MIFLSSVWFFMSTRIVKCHSLNEALSQEWYISKELLLWKLGVFPLIWDLEEMIENSFTS